MVQAFPQPSCFNNLLSESNLNLRPEQKELSLWHCKLGHINMKRVQSILAKPQNPLKAESECRIVQPSNNKSSHCLIPLCVACQFAKQQRRNPPTQITHNRPETDGALSVDALAPGERVSVDIYMSSARGRLPGTFGKERETAQYIGGSIFVDHSTRFLYHQHQWSTTAAETINSKHQFECFCSEHSHKVKEFIGDNNPFNKMEWIADCENQHQKTTFSGVGAHHQNYSERMQQTVFYMARAMLMHFAMHWPQQCNSNLWPFCVDHAVYLCNHLPDEKTKLSPIELFTGATFPNHHHLQRLHVFGCPVYVLDPCLQDGKMIPKWDRHR